VIKKENLNAVLANQSAAIRRFQKEGINEQDQEIVAELKGVFEQIELRARHALTKPTDIVWI